MIRMLSIMRNDNDLSFMKKENSIVGKYWDTKTIKNERIITQGGAREENVQRHHSARLVMTVWLQTDDKTVNYDRFLLSVKR